MTQPLSEEREQEIREWAYNDETSMVAQEQRELLAEIDRLRARLRAEVRHLTNLMDWRARERDEARAEVARLEAAGDALLAVLLLIVPNWEEAAVLSKKLLGSELGHTDAIRSAVEGWRALRGGGEGQA